MMIIVLGFLSPFHVLYEYKKKVVLIIASPFNRLIPLMLFTYKTSCAPCYSSIYLLNIRQDELLLFFYKKICFYAFLHLTRFFFHNNCSNCCLFNFILDPFSIVSIAMCTHFSNRKEQHRNGENINIRFQPNQLLCSKPIQFLVLYIYAQYMVRKLGLL